MGGERINKRMTYEEILAKSTDSKRVPFETRKR